MLLSNNFAGSRSARTGWPWVATPATLPECMPNGKPWPRISIVTPSYNQGEYLEETIRSVLLQGYPNLEYHIIDGGSSDASVTIIKRYAPWLASWVSERDNGQAHALNKGFARSTGELFGWINSDDLLLPGALEQLATVHRQNPSAILLGDVIDFDEAGNEQLRQQANVTLENLLTPWQPNITWHQPGIYVPCWLHKQIGPLDQKLRYAFDQDWMCRLLQCAPVEYLHQPIARFRLHGGSKTVGEATRWLPEQALVLERYKRSIPNFDWRAATADLELWGAIMSLSLAYRERHTGMLHLLRAFALDPRMAMRPRFLMLCGAAMLPIGILRSLNKLLHIDAGRIP